MKQKIIQLYKFHIYYFFSKFMVQNLNFMYCNILYHIPGIPGILSLFLALLFAAATNKAGQKTEDSHNIAEVTVRHD